MDTDFTFAFKRRSASPAAPDCLAPASLHNPSPPPSLASDATSQDSHGSPRDWASYAWPQHPGSDSVIPDNSWTWTNGLSDVKSTDTHFLPPPSIDPTALSFEDTFSVSLDSPHLRQNNLFSSASPLDLLPFLQSLPGFSPNTNLAQPAASNPSAMVLQPAAATFNPDALIPDQDLVIQAMRAAGIQMAAFHHPTQNALPSAIPAKSATPSLPKPDLAACPPLAKHLQASPSFSASTSGAASPHSTEGSPQSQHTDPRILLGPSGRPKTSHTTIERRYRTNLNARILSLRHAVPALRILEKDENQNPRFPDDILDERGYVDGVKAARKASKASVLGKAAEYIHVLKKREVRLRHEGAGLRMLVNSLVGGPALLREFENNWKRRYGGEEMDEVIDASDGEDGDDDCSDDDEDKPRKKPKVVKTLAPKRERKAPEPPSETGKRKRGRPKKAQPAPEDVAQFTTVPSPTLLQTPAYLPAESGSHHTGGVQYLLGAFLFFSFFKPSSDSHVPHFDQHHTHSGSVITPRSTPESYHPSLALLPWIYAFGAHHIRAILSILLVLSVVLPLVPFPRKLFRSPSRGPQRTKDSRIREALALSSDSELAKEHAALATALEVGGVFVEALRCVRQAFGGARAVESELEARAWKRFASVELALGVSNFVRPGVSSILALYRHATSSQEMMTLAMISLPFSEALSGYFWSTAHSMFSSSKTAEAHPAQAMVIRMSVQEAFTSFVRGITDAGISAAQPVVDAIASVVVLEAIQGVAKDAFVRTANHLTSEDGGPDAGGNDPLCDVEVEEASRWMAEVGGKLVGPSKRLLRMWQDIRAEKPVVDDDERGSGVVGDIQDLLRALALMRQTFPSSSSSYPSSPSTPSFSVLGHRPVGPNHLPKRVLLLQVLGSSVFSSDDVLEDARDGIVDMLDLDRKGMVSVR